MDRILRDSKDVLYESNEVSTLQHHAAYPVLDQHHVSLCNSKFERAALMHLKILTSLEKDAA